MKRFFSVFTLVCAIVLSTAVQSMAQSKGGPPSNISPSETNSKVESSQVAKLNTTDSRSPFEQEMIAKQRGNLHGVSLKNGQPSLGVVPQLDFRRKGSSRSILQAPIVKSSPKLLDKSTPVSTK